MKVISCLVPELRSETHRGRRTKVFKKMQCFYIVMVNCNFLYTIVLCKIDSCSCKKAARKSAKIAGRDKGGESGGLYCVHRKRTIIYKLEACEIAFFCKHML